jgi:hypothetical protein
MPESLTTRRHCRCGQSGRHAEMEFGTDTILEVIIILTYEQLLTENLQYLHRHNVSCRSRQLLYSPPYVLQNGSQDWKLEKIVPLPGKYKDYSISTVGAARGILVLSRCSRRH